jgi:ABC-type transport system involved in multi-copper enzyme maturation permease subunit
MVLRWGLGPVFASEWLTTSRRWQSYAGRAVFVGVLLVGLASVWVGRVQGQALPPIVAMAEIGRSFYDAIVFTQLTLVFLVAPAATAGAVCQDKSNGTLAQMLLTDLSDAEIVLGKLAARLIPVIGLAGCTLPVLAIAGLLGGIDLQALTGVFLITISAAIFGCTLAFTFSIWGTKPYEVLLATYAFFAVWMLTLPVAQVPSRHWGYPPVPGWTIATNPYALAVALYVQPGEFGLVHCVALSSALVLISAVLVVVAIARIRGVVARQADSPAYLRRSRGRLGVLSRTLPFKIGRDPSLDGNPLLWYEVHRQRSSAWIRTLIRLYFVIALVFTLIAIDDGIRGGWWNRERLPAFVVAFQVAISLPLVLVASTTALVEERVRGTLDVLMTTPISSRSIVLTKWWSVYRKIPLLLALPALTCAVLAWETGGWFSAGVLLVSVLSSAAFWTSIGLALSTWVPRLGRAISAAAIVYALINLGWPILAQTVFQNDWPLGVGLTIVSPFHASFELTCSIERPRYFGPAFAWYPGWIVVQAVVAVGLLLTTLATFDRCIGRIRG